MITRMDWRSSAIAVVIVLVVGLIFGLILGMVTSSVMVSWSQQGLSATEIGGRMMLFGYSTSCVLGFVYGAAVGGLYAWLAGRRKALESSDAIVGAGVSIVLFIVISGLINTCWSSTSVLMALQNSGSQIDLQGAGGALFSVLLSTVFRSGLELVVSLIAGIPTALGVVRMTRRA